MARIPSMTKTRFSPITLNGLRGRTSRGKTKSGSSQLVGTKCHTKRRRPSTLPKAHLCPTWNSDGPSNLPGDENDPAIPQRLDHRLIARSGYAQCVANSTTATASNSHEIINPANMRQPRAFDIPITSESTVLLGSSSVLVGRSTGGLDLIGR